MVEIAASLLSSLVFICIGGGLLLLFAALGLGVYGYCRLYKNLKPYLNDNKQTESISEYNPLTHLPNRFLLQKKINASLVKAIADHQKIAVLFINLDSFREVNAAFDYLFGDSLLQACSQRLRKALQDPRYYLAHLGADEFCILFTESKDPSEITKLINLIIQIFAEKFKINDHELIINASIGISVYPNDFKEGAELLKNADAAMHCAKAMGRNTFSFYSSEINEQTVQKRELEVQLRKALERNEFIIYYQPKVNIETGRIAGAEALIRWKHPIKGMVSPVDFIPLAEKTGVIVPIGHWVLQEACKQMKSWHNNGFPHLTIAINLSPYQFKTGDVASAIAEIVWETGLEPHHLELELTESSIMDNPEKSLLMLSVLKSMGIKTSIDDFGTGYSSLSQLHQLPINVLKIDQSFVKNITQDPESAAIINTMITMAHKLHLKVVAEGVETHEQLEYLKKEGCDEIQGFLFSKPITSADFEILLQKNLTHPLK